MQTYTTFCSIWRKLFSQRCLQNCFLRIRMYSFWNGVLFQMKFEQIPTIIIGSPTECAVALAHRNPHFNIHKKERYILVLTAFWTARNRSGKNKVQLRTTCPGQAWKKKQIGHSKFCKITNQIINLWKATSKWRRGYIFLDRKKVFTSAFTSYSPVDEKVHPLNKFSRHNEQNLRIIFITAREVTRLIKSLYPEKSTLTQNSICP